MLVLPLPVQSLYLSQSAFDQVEVFFWGSDAPLRFLLECVQNVYRFGIATVYIARHVSLL